MSEKSYRISLEQQQQQVMSKDEAATMIQKNYRAYRGRQDYLLMRKRNAQKMFLFRLTVRSGQSPQILTCSVNNHQGRPISISFVLQEVKNARHNVKMEIELTKFGLQNSTDLKDKVMRVIRDALTS